MFTHKDNVCYPELQKTPIPLWMPPYNPFRTASIAPSTRFHVS